MSVPKALADCGFQRAVPVIGMLHAPPLPGAPGYEGDFRRVREFVLRDAEALAQGGVHGLLLENFGDAPFFPGPVPRHVLAHMTILAAEIRRAVDLPLGINVLRNDACGALAVAHAAGGRFVRANILCGARLTDQGLIRGVAHRLLRERALLGASNVKIFADVDVKHSAPLVRRPLEEEVGEMVERGGADVLVLSGTGTGRPVDPGDLRAAGAVKGAAPVLVGSGVTAGTIDTYLADADGFIVGTGIKRDGNVRNPVDVNRVSALVRRLDQARSAAGSDPAPP